MLEIATHHSKNGVFQKDIAFSQDISIKYLDHIIQALKTAMLIRNVKGKKSGYILCCDPADITLYNIYKAFEPSICIVDCIGNRYECDRSGMCAAQGVYGELNQMIIDFMSSVTLKDLIDKNESLDLSETKKSPSRIEG